MISKVIYVGSIPAVLVIINEMKEKIFSNELISLYRY